MRQAEAYQSGRRLPPRRDGVDVEAGAPAHGRVAREGELRKRQICWAKIFQYVWAKTCQYVWAKIFQYVWAKIFQ